MLFATNGRVQDLPPDTQFEFWDDQMDWGRAFKVAKIQQQDVVGVAAAPAQELMVHLLLQSVANDPCKTFISRPEFQLPDWAQWARFARWFFRLDYPTQEDVLNNIRWGNCGQWLGQFLASNTTAMSESCFESCYTVDKIQFWDFHPWNPEYCGSDRQLPARLPTTPDELAGAVALAEWLQNMLGPDAKQFMNNPPQPEDHAQTVMQNASAPPPLQDTVTEDGDDTSSWLWPAIGLAGALAVGIWLAKRA